MDSIWQADSNQKSFKKLNGNLQTDVLIIGAGITGILCAYMLKSAGVNCIIAESGRVCNGITARTTAKITAQHGLIYDKLIKEFGNEKASLYLQANIEAIEKYAELCKNIDCGFERKDAYVYSTTDSEKLSRELNALSKIGAKADFVKNIPLPIDTVGAIRFKNQAQFNPLKFLSALTKDITIYENTRVLEIRNSTAICEKGKVKANAFIVTTHFPFINKYGSYFLKMYQERSYVVALENAQNVNGMYIDEAKGGLSFRNYKNMLLLGGGSHRTGKKTDGWDKLSAFAKSHYPDSTEKFRWATQDCMTLDGVPYIGHYSKNTPNLYVATGFNKWGMSSSMTAACILADLITGKQNKYSALFSPSRTILRPQLAINAFEAVSNILTPSKKRCPHLGCALKWNKQEHSWDCPCHGSRFNKDGILLDNPSTSDIK